MFRVEQADALHTGVMNGVITTKDTKVHEGAGEFSFVSFVVSSSSLASAILPACRRIQFC